MRSIRRPALERTFDPNFRSDSAVAQLLMPAWLQFNNTGNTDDFDMTAQAPGFALRAAGNVDQARFEELGPDAVAGMYPGQRGCSMERTGNNSLANNSKLTLVQWSPTSVTLDASPSIDAQGTLGAYGMVATAAFPTATFAQNIPPGGARTYSVWARQDTIGTLPGGGGFTFSDGPNDGPVITPDNHWRRYSFTAVAGSLAFILRLGAGADPLATIQFCFPQAEDSLYPQSTILTGNTIPGVRPVDKLILDGATQTEIMGSGFYDIELVFFPKYAGGGMLPSELSSDHNLIWFDVDNRVFIDTSYNLIMRTSGMAELSIGPIVLPRLQPLRVRAKSTPKGRVLSLIQGTGPENASSDPALPPPMPAAPLYFCGSGPSDGADQSCLLYYVALHWPVT